MPTDILYWIARFLLGGAFVVFGIRNLPAIPRLAETLTARKLPMPMLCAQIGVGLQLVGGALMAVGLLPWLGGILLCIFIVLATVLFHPFWEFTGEERRPHVQAAIMNTGLFGAFLMVIATSVI